MDKQNDLRLLVKIASLYYEEGLNQSQIAHDLNISQSFVSRAIKRCHNEGLVKVSVIHPSGTFVMSERKLQQKYKIKQVIIVDIEDNSTPNMLKRAVGSAAANYLQTSLKPTALVGISSWSTFISAMVDSLHPHDATAKGVIQILGGVGHNRNLQANILANHLAKLLNCPAYLLPTTSSAQTLEEKNHQLANPELAEVVDLFPKVDVAIVGIGTSEPSDLIRNLGIIYKEETKEQLNNRGAVGDICLHYYDKAGKPIFSDDEDMVISMTLPQLKECPEVIALAGGLEKVEAIKGALNGGYIDVLVTDRITAAQL
ncbi:MAG: sugar-binding transcriptional regulator [Alphaproteobacteria bacterium]